MAKPTIFEGNTIAVVSPKFRDGTATAESVKKWFNIALIHLKSLGVSNYNVALSYIAVAEDQCGGWYPLTEKDNAFVLATDYVGLFHNRTKMEALLYIGRGHFQLTGRTTYAYVFDTILNPGFKYSTNARMIAREAKAMIASPKYEECINDKFWGEPNEYWSRLNNLLNLINVLTESLSFCDAYLRGRPVRGYNPFAEKGLETTEVCSVLKIPSYVGYRPTAGATTRSGKVAAGLPKILANARAINRNCKNLGIGTIQLVSSFKKC